MDRNQKVDILLETMAGKGSEIASNFSEIKSIIDGCHYKEHLKVCLDTCHINDAGYDLNNFDEILKEFDNIIGLDKLACIHVNDSKNERNAHKDRHENIGYGTIGFENLLKVIYHPLLENIPKILETPYVDDENGKSRVFPPFKFEIEMIRKKIFNENLINDIIDYYEKQAI